MVYSKPGVLLVTMPLADPSFPNLAIETIAQIARSAGHWCEVLYGTLLIPPRLSMNFQRSLAGQAIFTPAYSGEDEDDFVRRLSAGLLDPAVRGEVRDLFEVEFLVGMDVARQCLDRCLARIGVGAFDVIGFSVGFDAQRMASAALAKALKAREPSLRILFGGTACDGSMARETMELFPEVDVVTSGPADASFPALIAALRGDGDIGAVPNCLYRQGGMIHATHSDRVALRGVMFKHLPNYESYLEQKRQSAYSDERTVLQFETSRGCWWGDKRHCSFCGIAAVGKGFLSRSPREAVEHIRTLDRTYKPDVLYSTDAILDFTYFREVLPELARHRRKGGLNAELFYEVKSNLRREQVALLAAAGVRFIQPGIESFSNHILGLMLKGVKELQQVELLKWAQAYGLILVYGVIEGTPGESAQDYREMAVLVSKLGHLQPPMQVNHLGLHKFSPYADKPELYQITAIQPFPAQRLIYGATDEALNRLCYELDYRVDGGDSPELASARAEFRHAVSQWQRAFEAGGRLVQCDTGDRIAVTRRTVENTAEVTILTHDAARVLRSLESPRTIDSARRRVEIEAAVFDQILDHLVRQGLVLVSGDSALGLPVPVNLNAFADAAIDRSPASDGLCSIPETVSIAATL